MTGSSKNHTPVGINSKEHLGEGKTSVITNHVTPFSGIRSQSGTMFKGFAITFCTGCPAKPITY